MSDNLYVVNTKSIYTLTQQYNYTTTQISAKLFTFTVGFSD